MKLFVLVTLCATSLLASCATNVTRVSETHIPDGSTDTRDKPIEPRKQFAKSFQRSGIKFDTRFKSGAAISVVETDLDHFEVLIKPENSPINDSAWFAFRVSATKPRGTTKNISVKLKYDGGTHRYHPKTSLNGSDWTNLADQNYQVAGDKKEATLHLAVTKKPLWVAAQEILDTDNMGKWIAAQTKHPFSSSTLIGHSTLGKEIRMLKIGEAAHDNKKILVVLGRQHPPETTGTIALMTFIETISSDTELARKFRREFDTVVIPMINPDGVDDGHWRHNRNGIDLNRDWAQFRQAETRVVSSELEKLKRKHVVFGIDFHSTFKDVFYVLLDRTPISGKKIADPWIKDIAANMPDYIYRIQPVTNDVPAASIWLNKTFGVDTVTYEVGDETERPRVRQIAKVAAEALMKRLLE